MIRRSAKYLSLLLLILSSIVYAEGEPQGNPNSGPDETELLSFEIDSPESSDLVIDEYLRNQFPIISDLEISRITSGKTVRPLQSQSADSLNNSGAGEMYKVLFEVPKNFMVDTAKILWELNIPEFTSRIYQLYNGRKIYIDTWPNVVGTIKTKTYTGNFEAYRIRNWPFYKDPDPKKVHVPPVKPGPGNPLGLFVVHYDQNSLRYFHGTNKNNLLYNEKRNLSHGCVRNDNNNIEKMKQFIIKKVVKSADLSGWLDSKKTLIYDFEEIDKFPVRIIYKTFNIDKDEFGYYIEMFDDIYRYADRSNIDPERDVDSLVIIGDVPTVKAEFNSKVKDHKIPEDALNLMMDYVVNKAKRYEKIYVEELKSKFML